MRQVQIKAFGNPEEVVEVAELPDLKIAEHDDILVRVLLAPIGPADLGSFWGGYPRTNPDSVVPGIEAIGVVEDVGSTVTDINVGDRVLVLPVDNWSEQLLLKREQVARVSNKGDLFQQLSLKSNGATAALLLRSIVDLRAGDWVVQNAANSTVGQYLAQIAKALGIRTINIVRNDAAADQLRKLGGDVVLIDGPDIVTEIVAAVEGAPIMLGLDCISGTATMQIAEIVSDKGTVVVYGALSNQTAQVHPLQLITKKISISGFWITSWFTEAPNHEIQKLITELDEMAASGKLVTEIASVHQLSDIKTAVRNAGQGGRNGKVVLDFRQA